MEARDARLNPILTPKQVGILIDRDDETVRRWARRVSTRDPLVTTRPNLRRGWPTVPLIGLAEARTTEQLRREYHFPMPKVIGFSNRLRAKTHDDHPFSMPKYVTDEFSIYVQQDDELAEFFTGQMAMLTVLKPFLRELRTWGDDRAGAFRPDRLNHDGNIEVEIDPRYNAGRLSFVRNRVPLFAIAGSLRAGDSIETLMTGYRLTRAEVELVDEHLDWLEEVA